jgi:hypothetical protein
MPGNLAFSFHLAIEGQNYCRIQLFTNTILTGNDIIFNTLCSVFEVLLHKNYDFQLDMAILLGSSSSMIFFHYYHDCLNNPDGYLTLPSIHHYNRIAFYERIATGNNSINTAGLLYHFFKGKNKI